MDTAALQMKKVLLVRLTDVTLEHVNQHADASEGVVWHHDESGLDVWHTRYDTARPSAEKLC